MSHVETGDFTQGVIEFKQDGPVGLMCCLDGECIGRFQWNGWDPDSLYFDLYTDVTFVRLSLDLAEKLMRQFEALKVQIAQNATHYQ